MRTTPSCLDDYIAKQTILLKIYLITRMMSSITIGCNVILSEADYINHVMVRKKTQPIVTCDVTRWGSRSKMRVMRCHLPRMNC